MRFTPLPILILGMAMQVACQESIKPIPDFSDCDCPPFYDPVCAEDGRSYLNDCFPTCLGIDYDTLGNCSLASVEDSDTLKWPIQAVCDPVSTADSPVPQYALSDGSVIYRRPDGTHFRGNVNMCRCLPASTLIATPTGPKSVASLQVGERVWSQDQEGNRIAQPILHMNRVTVGQDHQLLRIALKDGRVLQGSPLHPDAQGRPFQSLQIGDWLDGAPVMSIERVPYVGEATWDLLPAGETGTYWAQGVLVGSTLYPTYSLP